MKHEVDLQKYSIYTDLALESIKINKINKYDKKSIKYKDVNVTKLFVDKKLSKKINKKEGNYTTIEFNDITDSLNQNRLIKVLKNELSKFINVSKKDLILIVGLGNEQSTPDSLGPKCIDNIISTNQLYDLNILDNNHYRVATFKPSVYGRTGIETSDIIISICKKIKPSLVIIIDSLASGSIDRLNKTIQITDTGISPGSGIGNKRKEISDKSINTNVLALGVPTVVSEYNILYEILVNNDLDTNSILDYVINNDKYNLVVTPTEIDFIIDCLSKVIYTALNELFSDKISKSK